MSCCRQREGVSNWLQQHRAIVKQVVPVKAWYAYVVSSKRQSSYNRSPIWVLYTQLQRSASRFLAVNYKRPWAITRRVRFPLGFHPHIYTAS